jgi:hypothetical protein
VEVGVEVEEAAAAVVMVEVGLKNSFHEEQRNHYEEHEPDDSKAVIRLKASKSLSVVWKCV